MAEYRFLSTQRAKQLLHTLPIPSGKIVWDMPMWMARGVLGVRNLDAPSATNKQQLVALSGPLPAAAGEGK